MPMFLNVNKGGAFHKYMRYVPSTTTIEKKPTASKMGVELFGTPTLLYVGGENDGKAVEGPIKANQTVLVNLGTVDPQKFHVMLVVNPEILRAGIVGAPSLIEPEPTEVSFTIKALRQIEPSELGYWARLYLVD